MAGIAGIGGQLPPGIDRLERRIEDLERQVRQMNAARSLSASSFRGGAMVFKDSNGEPRWAMGQVELDGSIGGVDEAYGVFGFGDDNAITFMLQEGARGLVYPNIPIPMHPPTSIAVTSGTMTTLWECQVDFADHEVVFMQGAVQVAAGTVGELQLVEGFSGDITSVLTLPAGVNSLYRFEWLHPCSVGLYDQHPHDASNLFLGLQARRVSGAGTVTVFPPQVAEMTSRFLAPDADTSGHPTLL